MTTLTSKVSPDPAELAGREALVAVCGGISAYKVCHVVSSLVQRGAGVTVAMTESATRFVGSTTFAALSGRRVLTGLWEESDAGDPQHIRLMRAADIVLIAPATANMIGKIANGICDDLISTMVTAASCPVMLAPAMNDIMWAHPPVQANVQELRDFGYELIGPAEGWLACRSVGPGRMVESGELLDVVAARLKSLPVRSSRNSNS